MEGTGANLRLPLNPPFFFESQSSYDLTSGPAPSRPASKACRRSIGRRAQLRAWDPNLRPQFTQQWNLFAEYLIGSRSSINIGYVGNKSKNLVTPIEGNQPLPGTGDPSTWLPMQQRRPLYQFNPLITDDQHDRLARPRRLQRAADHVQAAAVERPRLRRQLHAAAGQCRTTWATTGRATWRPKGAYPVNSYDIEANYGPAFFDATAQRLAGRQLRAAVRQGPPVRHRLEPRRWTRWPAAGRLSFAVTAAQRLPDHGAGQLRRSLQAHALDRMAEPDRRRPCDDPTVDALDRPRCVRVGRRSARSATPASASCGRRATGTSTCR